MRAHRMLAVLMLAGASARAHDPITTNLTWTAEVSRIVYKHCVSCHHDGGQAFSLVTYEDARPWAKAIRDEVLARRMPPWGAVKGVGDFRDDPSLSQPERDILVGWVEGGAPQGDRVYLPRVPSFDPPAPEAPPAGARALTVAAGAPQTLGSGGDVLSIRPAQLAQGADLEVTAYEPDGRVEHLLWLRQYQPKWQRSYVYREPVRLPRGTRIVVYGPAGAGAVLQYR